MTTATVFCFARYAELLGSSAVEVEIPDAATVADLISALRQLPGGDLLPPSVLVAIDHSLADDKAPIAEGQELAILPPFAGG